MTKAKHTPGPWRIGDAGNTIFGPKTDMPAPETIADISGTKNREGNKRLIAASPELLDLLILALPYVEEGEEFNKPTRRGLSSQIRAAIAKADGE